MRRPLLLSLLVGVVLLAAGVPLARAAGTPILDDAARALRSDPVYVAPDAEVKISSAEADGLRRRIEQGDAGRVYLAVLPAAAAQEAGGQDRVAQALAERLRRRASYGVIVGRHFEGGSYVVPDAGRIADEAFAEHADEGPAAVLSAFVDGLAHERSRASGAPGGASGGGSDDNGGSATGLVALLAIVGGGLLLFTSVARRRRRREEQRQLEELKTAARDDLVALGDDIRGVDLDVEMPNADPRAREQLGIGLEDYERAERMLDQARHPDEIAEITRTIEEGRQALAAARALLDGREPPPRRPPCFFDPRHGPSTTQMPWAPPGGEPRMVPVCQADAVRLQQGEEPPTREVEVAGNRVPYWNAPAYFSPWAGGFFGGFGGGMFLPGLMAGTLLGSALATPGPAWGWGDGEWADDRGEWGGGDFDGSEAGGGGFGGGDFGGGDFGGGDFGGGDFGGGDF